MMFQADVVDGSGRSLFRAQCKHFDGGTEETSIRIVGFGAET
jgi:hypothetical protein